MKTFLYVVFLFATLAIIAFAGFGIDTWQYWAVAMLHIAAVCNAATREDGGNDEW